MSRCKDAFGQWQCYFLGGEDRWAEKYEDPSWCEQWNLLLVSENPGGPDGLQDALGGEWAKGVGSFTVILPDH
jgi:hypothetical protein